MPCLGIVECGEIVDLHDLREEDQDGERQE